MVSSYLLSSTFVPVLSTWLLATPTIGRTAQLGSAPFRRTIGRLWPGA